MPRREFRPLETLRDGVHRPIHFPGGDPLAKLAPVAPQIQPKKKSKKAESVLGIVNMPAAAERAAPGPVTIYKQSARVKPGPVTVFLPRQAELPDAGQPSQGTPPESVEDSQEIICEVCMRKFSSREMLQKHEQFSELHKQNLARRGRCG